MISCFNPHPHTGGDRRPTRTDSTTSRVSIHTPTRGATRWRCASVVVMVCFNPHPHTGGDFCACLFIENCLEFQSTPPHGGRLGGGHGLHLLHGVSIHTPTRGATLVKLINKVHVRFNPHPHTGGDPFGICIVVAQQVSIHTPTRGATCKPVHQGGR